MAIFSHLLPCAQINAYYQSATYAQGQAHIVAPVKNCLQCKTRGAQADSSRQQVSPQEGRQHKRHSTPAALATPKGAGKHTAHQTIGRSRTLLKVHVQVLLGPLEMCLQEQHCLENLSVAMGMCSMLPAWSWKPWTKSLQRWGRPRNGSTDTHSADMLRIPNHA